MADSILRLQVESSEYDAKLKRASEGLSRYIDDCRKMGGTLEVVEKDTMDYVKAVGQMDTTTRTATGKLSEMRKTFIELSAQYKQMTDAEKSSPFGKALTQSLDQLKGRIGESKTQLDSIKGSIDGGNGALDALAGKFTINIDAIKLFNAGIAAAKGALDVAKEAFFYNEQQLDEWGRVVQSSSSVYEGFLSAINTGDIGGYLSNIDKIIQAARDAYDALDALNTYNAFNQINVEKTRTGMTESIAAYREGTGSKDQVKAAGEAYKKELADRRQLEQDTYMAAIRETAAKRGISAADLQKALSGSYGEYLQLKSTSLTGTATKYVPGIGPGQQGSYQQYKVAANERERLGEALRQLNDTELQSLQAIGAQAQRTGNEIAMVDKQLVRVLNGRQGGVGSSSGAASGVKARAISTKYREGVGFGVTDSMNALNSQQSFWSKRLGAATNLADATAAQLSLDDIAARKELQPMALSLGISTEQYDMLQSSLTEKMDSIADGIKPIPIKLGIDPDSGIDLDKAAADRSEKTIKNLTADVSNLQKTTNVAGNAMNTLGAAIAGLEDPGAKVAGIIMQSIGNVVLGFSQAISKPTDPWSWIAGAVAGTATMISTIAAIHSATGYAEGGIVEGNSFSGDNIYAGNAMVNAGELILNKSQQSAIAGQLQGVGETMVGNRQDYVTGQKIFLGVNNYLKSTGRGQLVTTQ